MNEKDHERKDRMDGNIRYNYGGLNREELARKMRK